MRTAMEKKSGEKPGEKPGRRKSKENPFSGLDRKEHPLKSLYPAAEVIYGWALKAGKADIFGDRQTSALLTRGEDPEYEVRLGAYKTISYILAILITTVVLVILCVAATESMILSGNRLSRAQSGQGESVYELTVEAEKGIKNDISVTVSEQKCPEDKLDELFEQAATKLKLAVIADNPSADEVTGRIDLVKEIAGTSIKVKFDDPDPNYIFYDGTVRSENVTEPVIIYLTAELTYFDESRIVTIPIRLVPVQEDEAEVFERHLTEELTAADRASLNDRFMILPDNVDGRRIGWKDKRNTAPGIIAMLGLITMLGIIPAKGADLKKQVRLREKEMISDYPDIISKLSLLLTAGMTSRAAWEKICIDYTKTKNERKAGNKKKERYAYEEMVRTLSQMNLGRSESEAYEDFANHCRVALYQRLGSLLSKNLRRGSREMIGLLQAEAENAMEDRRQSVRQKGEEAGTKLLLPMFGMFGIVMAIVIVPAISSMGI